MKFKRLLSLLLILVLCFVLVSCGKDKADKNSKQDKNSNISQSSTITPLLYRVTDDDGNVAWLFGSVHVGRENFYPLPDYVIEAYNDSDSLAVEFDIVAFENDLTKQYAALAPMIYKDGSSIEDHIPSSLYENAVEILKEYDSYSSVMDMYCPAFWSSMIESLMIEEIGADADLGIDKHMLNLAHEEDKEILNIESAEFQYQMMADFDNDVQQLLLESAVESYNKKSMASASLQVLMNLWSTGNEKMLEKYFNSSDSKMNDAQKQIYQKYQKAMITDRNLSMAEFTEDALSSGDEVFICVGAAHIVGEGALVDLLSNRGYTVECVSK